MAPPSQLASAYFLKMMNDFRDGLTSQSRWFWKRKAGEKIERKTTDCCLPGEGGGRVWRNNKNYNDGWLTALSGAVFEAKPGLIFAQNGPHFWGEDTFKRGAVIRGHNGYCVTTCSTPVSGQSVRWRFGVAVWKIRFCVDDRWGFYFGN